MSYVAFLFAGFPFGHAFPTNNWTIALDFFFPQSFLILLWCDRLLLGHGCMMLSNSTLGDNNRGVQIGALVDSSGEVFGAVSTSSHDCLPYC